MTAMARQPRTQYPGALYHVMSRGNKKQDIFLEPVDRQIFLRFLAYVVEENNWLCYAYCLMNNHYHLLLQTPLPNLSVGMKYLNGVYSQHFNIRNNRVGHVMQGRYFSRLIESENYLLELSRYVVLNPVRAGLCQRVQDWKWTSYHATAGLAPQIAILQTDFILQHFSDDITRACEAYKRFINGESPASLYTDEKSAFYGQPEIPRTVQLSQILSDSNDRERRNRSIQVAYFDHGFPQTEIASFLGLHYSTISKIVKEPRTRS
jgi:putative transposase